MAKTPKANKSTSNSKPKSQPPATPKAKANAKPSKEDKKKQKDEERQAYYEANRERIDDLIAKCLKHFHKDEPGIVRAVARMLLDAYIMGRAELDIKESRSLIG